MNQKVKKQRFLKYLWLLHIPKKLRYGLFLRPGSGSGPRVRIRNTGFGYSKIFITELFHALLSHRIILMHMLLLNKKKRHTVPVNLFLKYHSLLYHIVTCVGVNPVLRLLPASPFPLPPPLPPPNSTPTIASQWSGRVRRFTDFFCLWTEFYCKNSGQYDASQNKIDFFYIRLSYLHRNTKIIIQFQKIYWVYSIMLLYWNFLSGNLP
jgi:hypothetical protein